MVGMKADDKRDVFMFILCAFPLTVIALPVLILSVALVEEKLIGSFHTAELCRQLGIFEEAEWLVQKFWQVF
jgi:hypothetical protein